MKIGIEVSNTRKAIKPTKDNIIIYDGKTWYITTKNDLFREYDERFSKKIKECEDKLLEVEEFKREISNQMIEMSETISKFILLQAEEGEK